MQNVAMSNTLMKTLSNLAVAEMQELSNNLDYFNKAITAMDKEMDDGGHVNEEKYQACLKIKRDLLDKLYDLTKFVSQSQAVWKSEAHLID